jgi:hypothetical protein
MADLAALLQASLIPDTRKQAEVALKQISVQPGFLPHLLQLVLDHSKEMSVRLAGSIYLKNIAKLSWDEVRFTVLFFLTHLTSRQQDVQPLPVEDKALLRSQLVPAMIALSGASDKAIRTQNAEAICLIAGLDFPSQWGDLITVCTLDHLFCPSDTCPSNSYPPSHRRITTSTSAYWKLLILYSYLGDHNPAPISSSLRSIWSSAPL